uniref:RNA helicase n=1 Tax=Nippostrongylus brasiliensis TaxID=27835 RepID=A0A0N4YZA7_NIPBR
LFRTFTASDRIDVLRVHDVSKAQAVQRAGRAGREAPGKCYRLYPASHFEKLDNASIPEILRSNLAAALGAAEIRKKEMVLTPIGTTLCRFPLSPDHARVLMVANELGCLEEALTVVAAMSCETVFDLDGSRDDSDMDRVRARFSNSVSDHLTVLNVVQAFKQEKQRSGHHLKEWCVHNCLNYKNLMMVLKTRKQLRETAQECGMQFASCGAQREKVRQALACGLFLNVCEYDRQEDRYRLLVRPGTTLKIHPSSRLCRSRPRHLVFTDLMRTSDLYARDVSIIDYEWVQPVIEEYRRNVKSYV